MLPKAPAVVLNVLVALVIAAAGFFAAAYAFTPGPSANEKNGNAFGVGLMAVAIGIAMLIAAAKVYNAIGKATVALFGLYDTVLPGLLMDINSGQ